MKDKPIQGAGHHVRAKTNTPIIGILTQPLPTSAQGHHSMWENQYENYKEQQYKSYLDDESIKDSKSRDDIFPMKQFIEATHIKYLEAAGARVIPIDYTLEEPKMNELLN